MGRPQVFFWGGFPGKDAGCGEHTWNRPSCKQGHAWFPVQPATIVFWDNFANTIFEQPHSRLMTGRVWNCVHWETGLQYVCTWWEFHILFVRIDTFFSFSFFPLVFAILAKRCKHLPVLPWSLIPALFPALWEWYRNRWLMFAGYYCQKRQCLV